MKMFDVIDFYLPNETRNKKYVRNAMNHCARTLGVFGWAKDYDSKEAIAIVTLFRRVYPTKEFQNEPNLPMSEIIFTKNLESKYAHCFKID